MVIEVGVVDEENLIGRVRDIVKTVKRPKAKKIFKRLLIPEKKTFSRLPLDCPTRWNSTPVMLSKAFEARHDLITYVNLHGSTNLKTGLLYEREWGQIKQLADFFEPMIQITLDCSAGDEPTFHLGKLCLTRLALHLRQAQEDLTTVNIK